MNEIFVVFVILALTIYTLVGAVILRAAISLYNKLVGGADTAEAVAEPPMGMAMGIIFVTLLANLLAGIVLGLLMAAAGAPLQGGPGETVPGPMAQLLFLLIGILLMAGTLAALLPTTFQRAFLVTLCYLLVAALVGGTLALVVLAAAWSVAIP